MVISGKYWNCLYYLWCPQTWLAGKSPIKVVVNHILVGTSSIDEGFSSAMLAMLDCRNVDGDGDVADFYYHLVMTYDSQFAMENHHAINIR